MTKDELKQALIEGEMPSSEAARLIDQLDEPCPHYCEGTCERKQLGFYEGLDKLEF